MDVTLSQLATDLHRSISPVREIMQFANKDKLLELGVKDETFISFGGGWVDHESPTLMQQLYVEFAKDAKLFHHCGAYSPTNGEPECQRAIAAFESAVFGVTGLQSGNIVIGQSSSQLTHLLLRVLLDPGDAICMLDPSYCNYPMQLHTAVDARLVRFPVVDVKTFRYLAHDAETLERWRAFLLEHRPKVVLLVSPDNPTSQVLSQEFVSVGLEAVKTYGGTIVMDFAYKTLTFGPTPEYFRWAPDGNFISVHSNSKWCHGLGRRLGWVEAPTYVSEAFESFQNSTILCPDRLHQLVLAAYVTRANADGSLLRYLAGVRDLYSRTADAMVGALRQHLRLPHFVPQGGLYTCLQVDENGAAFVERVLKNTGVLLIPGWGFGRTLNKAVRLSYGPHVHNHGLLVEGLRRIAEYLGRESPRRAAG